MIAEKFFVTKIGKVQSVDGGTGLVKHWTNGVPVDVNTIEQAKNVAKLPFIHKHIALMPDCHLGKGAAIGSVIPTKKAIIPSAVGVDIGCGMMATKLKLTANDLPDSLKKIRSIIESKIPVGNGKDGSHKSAPDDSLDKWKSIVDDFEIIIKKHPKLNSAINPEKQIGTLGGGNHFIEICLDEDEKVWVMLHSGSRGIGNKIGNYFITKAKEEMQKFYINLPDKDLAYLPEKSKHFDDYWFAVKWAQEYAYLNRDAMMKNILKSLRTSFKRPIQIIEKEINCHHNYVALENHFGEDVYVTRKGAIRARKGDMGIIPGSMGDRSYIVRGKGNIQSFHSCSHGAGRIMSRAEAKRRITVKDHIKATQGIECRKDVGVIDETPLAYKDIDAVMNAQADLVESVYRLKQVVCVKG